VVGGKSPVKIGNKVVIGAGVSIEGSTIEDGCLIGDGVFVANGTTVGKHAILLPGSRVPPNSTVPSNQIWAGSPAKFLKATSSEDVHSIEKLCKESHSLSSVHARECAKRWREVEEDEFNTEQHEERDHDVYYRRLTSQVCKHYMSSL